MKNIELFVNNSARHVCRKKGCTYEPQNTTSTDVQNGTGLLHATERNMNRVVYGYILEENVISLAKMTNFSQSPDLNWESSEALKLCGIEDDLPKGMGQHWTTIMQKVKYLMSWSCNCQQQLCNKVLKLIIFGVQIHFPL